MAERLIVGGFFDAIASQVPMAGLRSTVRQALVDRSGAHGA
jgi:Fe-S cluster assembly scaffold protein SufB